MNAWLSQIQSESKFPFLFGGAFIEATTTNTANAPPRSGFPFLFGGAFIEAARAELKQHLFGISLPFRRGFH